MHWKCKKTPFLILTCSFSVLVSCASSLHPAGVQPVNPKTMEKPVHFQAEMQESIWRLRAHNQSARAEAIQAKLWEAFNSSTPREMPEHPMTTAGRQVLQLEGVIDVVFKPDGVPATPDELYHRSAPNRAYDNMNSEVAAYKMDQLLGFDLVPMTKEYFFQNTRGSIQYLVYRMIKHSTQDTPNTHKMKLFDYIIGNDDRHPGNWLYWRAENRRIAIDHGLAFRGLEGGCFYNNSLYVGHRISCNPSPHFITDELMITEYKTTLENLGGGNIENEPAIKVEKHRIDSETKVRIQNLQPQAVEDSLYGLIDPDQIHAVKDRLKRLKEWLR